MHSYQINALLSDKCTFELKEFQIQQTLNNSSFKQTLMSPLHIYFKVDILVFIVLNHNSPLPLQFYSFRLELLE